MYLQPSCSSKTRVVYYMTFLLFMYNPWAVQPLYIHVLKLSPIDSLAFDFIKKKKKKNK